MKKKMLKTIFILGSICLLGFLISLIINFGMKISVKKNILNEVGLYDVEVDCIIVLGAGVRKDGTPSPMLEDRLKRTINVHKERPNLPIIVSGDHGREEYNEVDTMKKYLIDAGIPSYLIFMDHAGFSTYDSMYRLKHVFKVEKAIVVTQEYHLYRAIYLAKRIGIEAYGASSNLRGYRGQLYYDFREYLARNKDFVKAIFKSESTYLGEAIPVSGDGNITND